MLAFMGILWYGEVSLLIGNIIILLLQILSNLSPAFNAGFRVSRVRLPYSTLGLK